MKAIPYKEPFERRMNPRKWQLVGIGIMLLMPMPLLAQLCETAGKDGIGTPTGIVNTYYPGASSVERELHRFRGSPHREWNSYIAGDLLLVIQIQGAGINSTIASPMVTDRRVRDIPH